MMNPSTAASGTNDLSDRRLVIVTGAGAAHLLGAGEDNIPLMGDWAKFLFSELESVESGLAKAIGLTADPLGPEFEEAIGLFLQWTQALPLNKKFATVGLQGLTGMRPEINDWLNRTAQNSTRVNEELWRSLYRHFKADRVDRDKAQTAYARLDEALGGPIVPKKVATTNYDLSSEIGFNAISYSVKDGFTDVPWQTPTFDPVGLGSWEGTLATVSVLHLHGATGSYRRDGTVSRQGFDQDYNSTLGAPVILPPDPKKDPLNDATVSGIWHEFQSALASATNVLVLGHSLHDPALADQLRDAARRGVHVLIAGVAPSNAEVPDALTVDLEFGPNMPVPTWGRHWLESGELPIPPGTPATITSSRSGSKRR
jgi:hypothetical protein